MTLMDYNLLVIDDNEKVVCVCVGGVGWGVNIKTVNNVDLFFNVN